MPPFLPRKRLRSSSPEAGPSTSVDTRKAKGKSISTTPRKPTLFDDLDAGTGIKRGPEHKKALLDKLAASVDDDDDDSSLSSLSDEEFEDVPNSKPQKAGESEDEDEDIEFEDIDTSVAPGPSAPLPSGDLELTLTKDTRISITNPFGTKKGPSKIERQIRISTHQVHVQMLMFHNAIRNAWLCDKVLQELLVKQLPPSLQERVDRWRRDSGIAPKKEKLANRDGNGKGKGKNIKGKNVEVRNQRDWGEPAQRLAEGQVNMSRGDPIFELLKVLTRYWKQRFRITSPGLRKLGYMSLQRLDEESKSFKEDEHDPERHGERFNNVIEFRECAERMEGSRDVGAQLFTAMLRGLDIEARMVASLQPVGFGWSQNEEVSEKNPRMLKKQKASAVNADKSVDCSSDSDTASEGDSEVRPVGKGKWKVEATTTTSKHKKPKPEPIKPKSRGNGRKEAPINLSESENPDFKSDSESIIDVTPAKRRAKPSLPYDKDLLFPHYWTEVLSPVTNTYTAVDVLVLNIIANSTELASKFEPRGAKSEKAKQVTAYVIGHSPDGTAKDVTTRYLKRQTWPGRTKGLRYPVEKVPIYNHHGKVKRYQQKDWFKTVMSGYVRGSKHCPRTEIDDHEEATDLKAAKPEKKQVEEGKETLQYYKSSPDFILERHLRREEALIPAAQHVKMFAIGKGDSSVEEKVFRRRDVVSCKSMETWHKEGRAPKDNERPLKRVPYRAATTNRKRELAEAEHASGEKMLQGLYSWDQTDWIIPPPIENGFIPKNAYGNIDLYVDSMLPEGAAHIPFRGTMKICKRLGIDYAEAVTGFEFGHRMAVPIITGVVVAEEHEEMVMEEWRKDEVERVRKEDEKRRKVAISTWRKMLMGLRIVERVREEYGDVLNDDAEILNPFKNHQRKQADQDAETQKRIMDQKDEEMAGGFLPDGFHAEEPETHHERSFFPVAHDGEDGEEQIGGFMVEGHDEKRVKPSIAQAYAAPQSLEYASKYGTLQLPEGDVEIRDGSDVQAPPPKKRGRPSGSANTTREPKPSTATSSKAKTTAKQASVPGTLASRGSGKRRPSPLIPDSEDEEESKNSSLSEPEIGSENLTSEADETPRKAAKKGAGRNLTMPAKVSQNTRTAPKRQAARKSETALKSHYFANGDDE